MKKAVVGILTVAVILTLGIASVFAAGTGHRGSFAYAQAHERSVCGPVGINCGYNDADQDGICDTCGLNTGQRAADRKMAAQAAAATRQTVGHNYTDSNSDGICDNYDTYSQSGSGCSHNRDRSGGFGQGAGHHGGTHHR